jgi:hypothetical protein
MTRIWQNFLGVAIGIGAVMLGTLILHLVMS